MVYCAQLLQWCFTANQFSACNFDIDMFHVPHASFTKLSLYSNSNDSILVLFHVEDRKPLVADSQVEIPQNLKEQADAQIEALGGATMDEYEAEMVKAGHFLGWSDLKLGNSQPSRTIHNCMQYALFLTYIERK